MTQPPGPSGLPPHDAGPSGAVPPHRQGQPWTGQPAHSYGAPAPYGQPSHGQQGRGPQRGPAPHWDGIPPPVGPPPSQGGNGKWIFASVALAAVVALAITVIVVFARPESSGDNETAQPTLNSGSDFASANDTGPANIIVEDPTCEAWGGIARDFASTANSVGWAERDSKIRASDWTPGQRNTYETVSRALTHAAGLAAKLEKQTPHRVMRELYWQFIEFSHELVDAIPGYEYRHNPLANVSGATMSALSAICAAIDYRAIQPLAPLVPKPAPPTQPMLVSDRGAENSIHDTTSACHDWLSNADQYDHDTAAWVAVDANIPESDWTPEQRSIYEAVAPTMTANADKMEKLGRGSGNPVMEDFAVLAAQYQRAYVLAIPKYTASDNYVSDSTRYLASALLWACRSGT